MVQKSTKRGVHTGNTLRASNTRYSRCYRRQACILRNTYNSTEQLVPQELKETEITTDQVVYSLNKRKRWNLPAFIRCNIESGLSAESDDIRVALVERHKLKKQGNCIGFYATKGKVRRIKPRNGRYFNCKCVVPTTPRQTNEETQAVPLAFADTVQLIDESTTVADDSTNSNEKAVPVPEVRYEVFYPCSQKSSLSHNPKYIKTRDTTAEGEHVQEGRSKRRGKGKKRNRLFKSDALREEDNDDDFNFLSDDEEDLGWPELGDNQELVSDQNSFLDYFSHALGPSVDRGSQKFVSHKNGPKKKRNKGNRTTKKTNGASDETDNKDHIVFIEADDKIADTDTKEARTSIPVEKKSFPEFLPVTVLIPNTETTPGKLREKFGEFYNEVLCSPRKFILNISESVRSFFKASKHFARTLRQKLDDTAFLVFVQDTNYQASQSEIAFQVTLNLACKLTSMKIETIFDFENMTLDMIIDQSLSYLQLIPTDLFCDEENFICSHSRRRQNSSQSVVRKLNPASQSYNPYQGLVMSALSKATAAKSNISEVFDSDIDTVDSHSGICGICFEEFGVHSQVTQLLQCRHKFCNTCWQEHLRNEILSGNVRICCPEYDCDVAVDVLLMSTLVNVRLIKTHLCHIVNNNIAVSSAEKWCPQPHCGHVLKMENGTVQFTGKLNKTIGDSPEIQKDRVEFQQEKTEKWTPSLARYSDMYCMCGKQTCFQCLNSAHWPATCEQAAHYQEHLHFTGDEMETFIPVDLQLFKVRGKHCPMCGNFLEKFGGCMAVHCRCGHSFCWNCFGPAYHAHRPDCKPKGDDQGTLLLGIQHKDRKETDRYCRTSFYLLALEHHKLHKDDALQHLHRQGDHFCRTLINHVCRTQKSKRDILQIIAADIDREVTNPDCYKAVSSFVRSLLDMKHEVHRVIEYTYVSLDNNPQSCHKKSLMQVCRSLSNLCEDIHLQMACKSSDLRSTLLSLTRADHRLRRGIGVLIKQLDSVTQTGHSLEKC